MNGNRWNLLRSVNWRRTLMAFVLAPLSPSLILILMAVLLGVGKVGESVWLLKLSALLGLPIAIGLGLPIFVLLIRLKWNSLGIYAFLGAFAGLLLYLIYVPPLELSPDGMLRLSKVFMNTSPIFAALGVICGVFATIVFWFIARPDRQ